jgi:hypothetical protein
MPVHIRPTRIPEDLATLTELRNAFESDPITAEEMGRRMARVVPGQIYHRHARRYGAERMRTHNDSENAPILAIGRWATSPCRAFTASRKPSDK